MKNIAPQFTIFVKDNVVHGVISHSGEEIAFQVVDYDLLKARGTTAEAEFEKHGLDAFEAEVAPSVPIEDLIKHL